MSFLLALFVSLAAAFFLSELLRKFGIPRVVGQITAGLILGIPLIKDALFTPEIFASFSELSNIAIILLFFFVGLGINLRSFKKNLKEGLLVSFFNTIIPFILGIIIAHFLGLPLLVGIVLGITFAVSSQTVTFDLLEEFGLLKGRIGNLIVAAGAIDDIIEFILLSVVLTAIQLGQSSISAVILNVLAFVGIITIFKSFLIPRLLIIFEKEKSQRALFIGAIIITTLMAFLADFFGLSGLVGAFAAGMIVRHTLLTGNHPRPREEHAIAKTLDTVSFGFFIPLFFVFIGLNTDISNIENLKLGVIFSIFAILGTLLGSAIGVILSKRDVKEAVIVGLGVTPKGDVDLVIASLAVGSGLLSQNLFSSIVFMAIITTLVAPILFRHFARKWKATLRK